MFNQRITTNIRVIPNQLLMLIIIQFIFVMKIIISFKILFLNIQTLTNLKIVITDRCNNLMINYLNYSFSLIRGFQ